MTIRLELKLAAILVIIAAAILSGCGGASAVDSSDVERRTAKPPVIKDDRPKIVAFGDSLTAGFGLSEQESYPYLLQKRLEADGYDYEVVNAGVSGDTTLGGLERIDWVLEEKNVEILILELGANDLMRNVPVEQMRSNLDKILTKASQKGVKILFCGMLAPASVGPEYQREFVNTFADLADKHEVRFLPFLLENVALEKDLNQADGIHPNAKGTVIMTENIYKELGPLLEKAN